MSRMWRIELLGGLTARCENETVSRFRSHATGALLAQLAFHRGQTVSRETVIESVWPGCEVSAGRNRLSVALSSLRSQLGVEFGGGRDDLLLPKTSVETDTWEFENALRRAAQEPNEARESLESAIALYRGALLPQFEEEWIGPQRARLEAAFFRALRLAIALHQQSGDWPRAIQLAERGLSFDATREDVGRDLLGLLLGARRFEAAQNQSRALSAALQAAQTAPQSATRALMEQVEARLQEHQGKLSALSARHSVGVANLPRPRTRYFGRETERAQLAQWLHDADEPLLTLTGSGGSGKTRLSIEALREVFAQDNSAFPGGAWWVALADVNEPSLVPQATRAAMHRPALPHLSPLEDVLQVLAGGPTLLCFDNGEHLLPGLNEWIVALLDGAPGLKVLLSSRRRLGVSGERELFVEPLPLSENGAQNPSPAVQLFCDRARAARGNFCLDADNRADVERLMRRLDGVPLAIELGAARANVLSPREMVAHLEAHEDILATTHADIAPRHRTLRATIEWSFGLLPPELGAFWLHLAIFRGGCTLEAAREVCGGKNALEALSLLRDHSLLTGEENESGTRFRMLETLREWAIEQLSPSELNAVARRHAEFFLSVAEKSEAALIGAQQTAWLARLGFEVDNVRAAFAWCAGEATHDDACREIALRLSISFSGFWERRGVLEEGRAWMETALARSDVAAFEASGAGGIKGHGYAPYCPPWHDGPLAIEPAHWRARCYAELGGMAWLGGDYSTAQTAYERSQQIFRALDDVIGAEWSTMYLGWVATRRGDYSQARGYLEHALQMAREMNLRELEVETLSGLVNVALGAGDLGLLARVAPEKLALREAMGDRRGIAFCQIDMAFLKMNEGDAASAREWLKRSLKLLREIDDPWGSGRALLALAGVERADGQTAAARGALHESLRALLRSGNRWEAAVALEQCAQWTCEELQAQVSTPKNSKKIAKTSVVPALTLGAESAAQVLAAAGAWRQRLGTPLPEFLTEGHERAQQWLSQTVSLTALQSARAHGENCTLEESVTLALEL